MVNFIVSDSHCYSDLKFKYNNSRRQNRSKFKKSGKDQNDLIVDDDEKDSDIFSFSIVSFFFLADSAL